MIIILHMFIDIAQVAEEPFKHDPTFQKIENKKQNSTVANKEIEFVPTVSDFITSAKRLMMNPILTCNNFSGVFYILGASAYITFMSKYMEVLFGVSAAKSSMITGKNRTLKNANIQYFVFSLFKAKLNVKQPSMIP